MRSKRSGFQLAASVVGIVVLAVLTGCTAETPTNPEGASGEPIKIMTISVEGSTLQNYPEVFVAAEAAVKGINEAGGINGRPIELIQCNERRDPNDAAQCARQAATDGVVAVVGSSQPNSPTILPILEDAGIASFGEYVISPAALESAIAFPLDGGGQINMYGLWAALARAGADTIDAAHFDVAYGDPAPSIAAAALCTAQISADIPFPAGSPDIEVQLTTVRNNAADGVIWIGDAATGGKIIRDLRGTGGGPEMAVHGSYMSEDFIAEIGSGAEGVYTSQSYAPVSSDVDGMAEFRDTILAADSSVRIAETSLTTWIAFHIFAQILSDLGDDITKESVLAALQDGVGPYSFKELITDFSTAMPVELKGVGTVYNTNIWLGQVVNGQNVPLPGMPIDTTSAASFCP